MMVNLNGPGATLADPKVRNPYDISSWGAECGRGINFQAEGVKKGGRKAHGSASGDLKRSDDRNHVKAPSDATQPARIAKRGIL